MGPGDLGVRRLEPDDVGFAVELAREEGWAFDEPDLHRLLEVGGGYAVEGPDGPVGYLTCAVYGALAWVGNVIVAPPHRGLGVGERLVRASLEDLRDRGVGTVRLYAVLRAVSLYERVGFEREGGAASLHGRGRRGDPPAAVEPLERGGLDEVMAFDEDVFGASRRRLLEALLDAYPDHAFQLRDDDGLRGYVVAKPAEASSELGPAVVRPGDEEAMRLLVDAGLAAVGPRPCEAGVRGENPAARRVMEARGFREAFPAMTMRWGRDAHGGDPRGVLLVGGMEKG